MLFKTDRISPQNIPLQLLLIAPFLLQIFAVVGLVGYLSFRNGQKAVNDLAGQLMKEVGDRIETDINNTLKPPHLINAINTDAIRLGQLNIESQEDLERHFWQQSQRFNSVTYIYFGNEQGGMVLAGRDEEGRLVIRKTPNFFSGDYTAYSTDEEGNTLEVLRVLPKYDARIRPWYRAAVKAGQPIWTEIYPFFSYGLGISAVQPVYDTNGTVQGVLAADFLLSQINTLLQDLRIGKSGKTFIVERSGLLIASSTTELPFIINNETQKQERLAASASSNLLIKSAADYAANHFGDLGKINSEQQLKVKLNGQQHFLQVTPFADGLGINWLVFVVVPEADFMGQINRNTRTTIVLCILALMLATLMGILTSRWIAQPLWKLSEASQAIASGELNQKIAGNGVKELGILAQSFNRMASQLRESFTALEKTNEQLEIRVEERTNELKKAKETADAAASAALAANRTKSEFLANMSHELRTPLNAILGFTQIMSHDTSLSTDQQENIGIIIRSGEHLLSLINDVLDMSKIEAGRISLNENSFDLYHLIKTIEQMLELKARDKGLTFQVFYSKEVPQYVFGDESKLRQVLINLLGNAIKFTQEGTVTLRIGLEKIEANDRCKINVTVEDTGPGISPTEMNSLFEAFVQTQTGRNSQEGTGLGLPISQKFVQLMGGDISVNSIVDQGTTFKFNVKLGLAEAADIQLLNMTQRVIGLAHNQEEYRILIVDDRLENRLVLVKLLSPLGFQVREATNGQEAISLWSTWQPHLIWMDMRMPVMDGYEATKQIKATIKGQATAIIALTASTFEQERSIVLDAGCNDFVCKPFRKEVILEKIAQHLGVRYIYEQPALSRGDEYSSVGETELTPEDLGVMPKSWVSKLYEAAELIDDELLFELIEQIPPEKTWLSQGIGALISNFRYEEIIELVEKMET